MDPGRRGSFAVVGGIPRTRGDGPAPAGGGGGGGMDSPHPRGWTAAGPLARLDEPGFPAPAGMDPATRLSVHTFGRIPRTRGDGPSMSPSCVLPVTDSPHPRGWTLRLCGRAVVAGGFPAPAGMDREGSRRHPPRRGIPRTRGDGPGKARGRGWAKPDSPHPRGWTRRIADADARRRGFPAPAGMDPARRRAPGEPARIPRTRGDGPRPDRMVRYLAEDSPHPRGWTRYAVVDIGSQRGFPAPAGMDPARP